MRTILVRSLQSVLAFASVALLTGANDAGCGLGTVIGGEGSGGDDTTVSVGSGTVFPGDPPIACPSGMVVQLVCDPQPSGGGVASGGWCNGPNCPPPPPPCNPADPNCTVPFPGDDDVPQPPPPPCKPGDPNCSSPGNPPPPCDPADPDCSGPYPGDPPPPPCDPADPDCSSPGNPPTPCDPADPGCTEPYPGDPPPPPCDPADPDCSSPGIPLPWPCEPGADCPPPPPPPPPPPGCSYQCVPAGPICPPGMDQITQCAGSGGGSEGTAGGGQQVPGGPDTPVDNVTCWTECVPHPCGTGGGSSEPGNPGEPSDPGTPEPAQPK